VLLNTGDGLKTLDVLAGLNPPARISGSLADVDALLA
jgi:hypothetical protein